MPIIVIEHPETGSSTSLGSDTVVGCLEAAIEWLGGEFRFMKEGDDGA